ncbi:UNVERIFIED_CONTAM: hypothetical protein FKN15_012995 [Acipenser sinensis]
MVGEHTAFALSQCSSTGSQCPPVVQHSFGSYGCTAAFLQVPVFRTETMAHCPQKFPAFPDFMEEVRSSWDRPASGPSVLKHAPLLASLEGTDKLGLAGFPPVDSTIAALVKASLVGGLARDQACPNPQCKVTMMEHQLAVVFLLIAQLQSASGMSSLTYLGTTCIDDCKLTSDGYTCQSFIHEQEKCLYCSPQDGQDYRGRKCMEGHRCDKHGKEYYWCKIDLGRWGYCGLFMNDTVHLSSQYHVPCEDSCEQRGSSYFWCKTREGWDYCSPIKNVGIHGNKCKPDHPCGRHREKYDWCKLEKGSWEKCGQVEVRDLVYNSNYYKATCQDECRMYERGGYYWCNTLKGWDYCSPLPSVTYRNEACRPDHPCGSHGKSYNWCYTQESWDYCGIIQDGEHAYQPSKTRKRALSEPEKTCIDDKDNKRKTTFTKESTTQIVDGNSFKEAGDLIRLCDFHVNAAAGTLKKISRLRIDLQGHFHSAGQIYNNYQMQINTPRVQGQSTTIAQVLVQDGANIPDRYIRRAFVVSVVCHCKVTVSVTQGKC